MSYASLSTFYLIVISFLLYVFAFFCCSSLGCMLSNIWKSSLSHLAFNKKSISFIEKNLPHLFLSFISAAFVFNWVGFVLLLCFCHTVAGRTGALAGFGLSLAKWAVIVRHSTDLVADSNTWLLWLIMALGKFYMCLCHPQVNQLFLAHYSIGWNWLSQSRLFHGMVRNVPSVACMWMKKTVTVHYSGGKLIAYIVVLIFTEHYRVKMWKFIIMGTSGIVSDLHDYYYSSVVTFHQEYYMINIF